MFIESSKLNFEEWILQLVQFNQFVPLVLLHFLIFLDFTFGFPTNGADPIAAVGDSRTNEMWEKSQEPLTTR